MAVETVPVQRRLRTVTEYEQMVAAGVFPEDDRIELIEGELITMSPIGGRHILVVNRLTHLLGQQLGSRAVVSVQNPIQLADSEPQPDVVLLHPRTLSGPAAVPGVDDVLLVVEVSDTTQPYDRRVKIPLYAAAGIGETWLIDLAEDVVEVYREPGAKDYRAKQTLGRRDILSALAFGDVQLSVEDLLR